MLNSGMFFYNVFYATLAVNKKKVGGPVGSSQSTTVYVSKNHHNDNSELNTNQLLHRSASHDSIHLISKRQGSCSNGVSYLMGSHGPATTQTCQNTLQYLLDHKHQRNSVTQLSLQAQHRSKYKHINPVLFTQKFKFKLPLYLHLLFIHQHH